MKFSAVIVCAFASLAAVSCGRGAAHPLTDPDATRETIALYDKLFVLQETGIMFGAQCPTLYGLDSNMHWTAAPHEYDRSDTKLLAGSNPAVCGWELGGLEYGHAANLDGDDFDVMREHIIAAYGRGAVNTISWHCANPVTDGSAWDSTPAVATILEGGVNHDKFVAWMDRIADFLASLRTDDGTMVPVIFRPWHEHTNPGAGYGFWWSVGNCSNGEFARLWRETYEYMRDVRGLHNLIWAYSPDLHHLCWEGEGHDRYVYLAAWPGDEYVDLLGLDAYETPWSNFREKVSGIVDYAISIAEEKGKPFAITETGFENNQSEDFKYWYDPAWWTEGLYDHMLAGRKVSFVLVWRDAGFPSEGKHYFNAFRGCGSEADFKEFLSRGMLLEDDLPDMYK